ncbi:putative aldehyde dehydrogenase [Leishmania major strain Friedlin]|uniref:Succinate-semialdehyde dehydrogenase, mitochondrial n=1 Tax=Leishmania major TaxID=5664 RepID=Q4Q1P8_LEIMA|nr:putative aldehyde dehydrogenase [Leishmania major strain Friedlin]CAG9583698.1 aldehyde_dehydrogenase_-_putative [Leishmania major strain Friedlin]CAJ09131.1 putative aldehyde dehydrogenase [Leishmania major strain Friedlin]|eukprot:XP_001686750.1 putative aldehyde dehydrogenase [Leishmania major strain Friedlin]
MSKLFRTVGAKGFQPFDWANAAQYASGTTPMMKEPACYINGAWVASALSDKTVTVEDPCTNQIIGAIPCMGYAETTAAIEAARAVFERWKEVMPRQRAGAVRRWGELMRKHCDVVANILSRESGKVVAEGKGEVLYAQGYADWYAGEAERIYGDIIPGPRPGVQTTVFREPVGVVGIITPWNFPAAMIMRAACGAIAAGCTVVLKPAELTPFTAMALAQLADEAGIPPGVFNVVAGDAPKIGDALVESFDVRKVSFTGSTRVGQHLYRRCSETMKKVTMELGGNAPCIVFEDADLPRAADQLIAAKFRNAGQTCICVNRALVQASVYDEFKSLVADRVRALKVGSSFDPAVKVGAVIGSATLERMTRMVEDAVEKGATLMVGGKAVEGGGYFFEPTLLTNVPHDTTLCCRNELFGPVLPLVPFDTEDVAVKMANDTQAGLASYFFTNDYRRQHRVARALRYGMVGVNDSALSSPAAPFGGVKESGLGRDGSKYGIESFVDIKYVLFSTV